MKANYPLIIARLENDRAAAPYSRSSVPRPGLKSGWNMEDTPNALRALAPGSADDLPAASLARLARIKALAQGSRAKTFAPGTCAAAVTFEEEKKIPMSFSPPRFKTQKNGKTVEEKWLIRLIVRSVSFTAAAGVTKEWKTSARLKAGEIVPPSTGPEGTSFASLHADFKARWGTERATALVSFLRHA